MKSVEFKKIVLNRFLPKNCQKTYFFAVFWFRNHFYNKKTGSHPDLCVEGSNTLTTIPSVAIYRVVIWRKNVFSEGTIGEKS
jgi:hypothetical protein